MVIAFGLTAKIVIAKPLTVQWKIYSNLFQNNISSSTCIMVANMVIASIVIATLLATQRKFIWTNI